jgi:hypothetical protein
MAFKKGESGNPKGRAKEKPFTDALRMEIAAAGEDHKALRAIARNLLMLAQIPNKDALPAIATVADRLEGKPAQESTVTIDDKRTSADWTRDELVSFLNDCRNGSAGTPEKARREDKSDRVH